MLDKFSQKHLKVKAKSWRPRPLGSPGGIGADRGQFISHEELFTPRQTNTSSSALQTPPPPKPSPLPETAQDLQAYASPPVGPESQGPSNEQLPTSDQPSMNVESNDFLPPSSSSHALSHNSARSHHTRQAQSIHGAPSNGTIRSRLSEGHQQRSLYNAQSGGSVHSRHSSTRKTPSIYSHLAEGFGPLHPGHSQQEENIYDNKIEPAEIETALTKISAGDESNKPQSQTTQDYNIDNTLNENSLQKTKRELEERERRLEEEEREIEEIKRRNEILRQQEAEMKFSVEALQKKNKEHEDTVKLREEEAQIAKLRMEALQRSLEEQRAMFEAKEQAVREAEEEERFQKVKEAQMAEEEQRIESFKQETKRLEDEAKLKYEAEMLEKKRQEEENRIRIEMEKAIFENEPQPQHQPNDKLLSQEAEIQESKENSANDKEDAKAAARALIHQREEALRASHFERRRKIDEIVATACPPAVRRLRTVSYAQIYSSPTLYSYSPPVSPPLSPFFVPEEVKRAAKVHQEFTEKQKRQKEAERLAAERQKRQMEELFEREKNRREEAAMLQREHKFQDSHQQIHGADTQNFSRGQVENQLSERLNQIPESNNQDSKSRADSISRSKSHGRSNSESQAAGELQRRALYEAALNKAEVQKRRLEEEFIQREREHLERIKNEQSTPSSSDRTASEGRKKSEFDQRQYEDSLAAKNRAAEIANSFMARQALTKSSRTPKPSMYSSTNQQHYSRPRRVSYSERPSSSFGSSSLPKFKPRLGTRSHVKVYNMNETLNFSYDIVKEIESSTIVHLEKSSALDYLSNDPAGKLQTFEGTCAALQALISIAEELKADAVIKLKLQAPVLVDRSRVNFSAKAVRVKPFTTQRSALGRTGTSHNKTRNILDNTSNPVLDYAASAPVKPMQTPSLSANSEPFAETTPVVDVQYSPPPITSHRSNSCHSAHLSEVETRQRGQEYGNSVSNLHLGDVCDDKKHSGPPSLYSNAQNSPSSGKMSCGNFAPASDAIGSSSFGSTAGNMPRPPKFTQPLTNFAMQANLTDDSEIRLISSPKSRSSSQSTLHLEKSSQASRTASMNIHGSYVEQSYNHRSTDPGLPGSQPKPSPRGSSPLTYLPSTNHEDNVKAKSLVRAPRQSSSVNMSPLSRSDSPVQKSNTIVNQALINNSIDELSSHITKTPIIPSLVITSPTRSPKKRVFSTPIDKVEMSSEKPPSKPLANDQSRSSSATSSSQEIQPSNTPKTNTIPALVDSGEPSSEDFTPQISGSLPIQLPLRGILTFRDLENDCNTSTSKDTEFHSSQSQVLPQDNPSFSPEPVLQSLRKKLINILGEGEPKEERRDSSDLQDQSVSRITSSRTVSSSTSPKKKTIKASPPPVLNLSHSSRASPTMMSIGSPGIVPVRDVSPPLTPKVPTLRERIVGTGEILEPVSQKSPKEIERSSASLNTQSVPQKKPARRESTSMSPKKKTNRPAPLPGSRSNHSSRTSSMISVGSSGIVPVRDLSLPLTPNISSLREERTDSGSATNSHHFEPSELGKAYSQPNRSTSKDESSFAQSISSWSRINSKSSTNEYRRIISGTEVPLPIPTPREIPLPIETPREVILPVPTPREVSLPESPIFGRMGLRSSRVGSRSSWGSEKFEDVWVGDYWESPGRGMEGLKSPIKPLKLNKETIFEEVQSRKSSGELKPLIEFDELNKKRVEKKHHDEIDENVSNFFIDRNGDVDEEEKKIEGMTSNKDCSTPIWKSLSDLII
ncbi:expressed protein [Phakopsora pachyrhizi]|uniref:Expressed protein n=1 Tax=Phakopsora pachyrhizi TaxID=170000 RepID=A0AAV0BR80_PHAPC|nr:expressed protein [Phakopsora pachyrhizi]